MRITKRLNELRVKYRPPRTDRTDIQALRALAVTAVVVFHLWPSALPGGYVGVDVFFVISGFLIHSQLLREIERSGTLDLPAFWVRRIKRLQPAALLVLFATMLGIVLWVPRGLWVQWLQEVLASALQVQNWLLGFNAVDYLAAADAPSPVQHYWTLSVEEQFYLGFPLLLAGALWLAKREQAPARRVIATRLLLVALVSLLYALWLTIFSPSFAYFSTVTRAWEFLLGALLALWPRHPQGATRHLASLSGVAFILVACWLYGADTDFPGSAALLPVGGTLLCLWAGRNSLLESAGRLRPIAALGKYSYAIYLWHWPLIVLAPYALLHWPFHLATPYIGPRGQAIVIAVLTLIAARLSTNWVEDPIRFSPHLDKQKGRIAGGLLATLTLLLVACAVPLHVELERQKSIRQMKTYIQSPAKDEFPDCFGAKAMDPAHKGCPNPALEGVLLPDLALLKTDGLEHAALQKGCWNRAVEGDARICTIGPETGYEKRLYAIGDSHVYTLLDVYEYIAHKNHWRIDVSTFSECYLTTTQQTAKKRANTSDRQNCLKWRNSVIGNAHKNGYDALIVSHSRITGWETADVGKTLHQTIVDGLVAAWAQLPRVPIIAIIDNPGLGRDYLSCLHREMQKNIDRNDLSACNRSRKQALPSDGQQEAAWRFHGRVKTIDLTDFYCTASECPAVIGNVIVYRDDNHITRTYAKTLAPYFHREITAALGGS